MTRVDGTIRQIRPFVEDDIPQVADLYQRVFGGGDNPSTPALRSYLNDVFFHNPWYDETLSSLVYEERVGKIAGFLGVIPRRMLLNGRLIRVAVSSSFMVEPGSRSSLAAVQLLKEFFSGSQDLSLTDGANDTSRRIWERLGGTAVLSYSIQWTRPLRPARYAMCRLEKRRNLLQPFAFVARLFCWAVDAIVAWLPPNRFPQSAPQVLVRDLDAETLLACIDQFSHADSLRPEYNHRSLQWLLGIAAQKQCYGTFQKGVVRNVDQQILGWYLYYLNPGRVSQVLQIGARKNSIYEVLHHLFYDAWHQGSIAITGRLEPRFLQEFSDEYCLFQPGSWMLIHTHNPELLQVIHRGNAFLTRLEGEWWTRFPELVA